MLFYGRAQKVAVFAVDTATGVGKTGDVSNFTLQVSKDGAANSAASNTPTEIGYGLYSLELTASECSADLVCVSGVSSTSGVSISPIIATTEAQAIPYATAGAASGLALTSSVDDCETKIDSVLEDTGTTLPATLATIDTNVDSVLVDTGTTLPASLSTIDTNVDSIKTVTDALPDSGSLSSLATASALSTVDTVVDSISSSLSSGVTCVEVSSAAVEDVFSTHAIAEEYSADGSSSATPGALLWLIQQALTEFAISGTSVTIKKADGSTTAAVYTLDSSTSPTSRTWAC